MMRHYECLPNVWHAKTLVFDWDDEAGVVTGRDAAQVREMASWGGIDAGPPPQAWEFSPEPLKSKTDMAAIVGWEHVLPEDLAAHYPQLPAEDLVDGVFVDDDGNRVVIDPERIVY